jgi:hypothetical protein
MSRDLDQAIERFDAAEKIHLVVQWVSWPEYDSFVAALRLLAKEAQLLHLDGSLRSDYENLWRIRRIIRTSPVSPARVAKETALMRTPAGGVYGERLQSAFDTLDVLCATENPLTSEIRSYLNGQRRQRLEPPARVQILVDRMASPMFDPQDLAVDTGYAISLLTVGEARRCDVADVMFVLSDPEEHDSGFKAWELRTRSISWIFNAPSARRVICLLLNDSREFDVSRFEVWPGAGQFDAVFEGRRERIDLAVDYVPPPFRDPEPVSHAPDEQLVNATRFRLADGSVVYFSDSAGPKPHLLVRDDFGVELVEAKSVGKIQRGSVLLVNAAEASRSFITREADRILLESYDAGTITGYRSVVARYKEALLSADVDELVRRAKTRNLAEHNIRQQINRARLPDSFATQNRQRFEIICSLIGLPVDGEEWVAVSRLQGANRSAGRVAKDRLRQAIAYDDGVYDRILEPSLVAINDPDLGSIVVSAVVENPVKVTDLGVSNLGVIKPPK